VDLNHYIVVAEVRERLSVSKEGTQKCEIGSFELNKPNRVEVAVPYEYELQRLHSRDGMDRKS
jgi:hypothetical protein